jgi:hypothetical protein
MSRTDPAFYLTEQESVFTAQFNREVLSGESGPAFAWLKDNELDPALMVAFQWALEPKTSVEARPRDDPSPSQSLVAPWPTAEVMQARVDEIVAAYPWLEDYTEPATPEPHREDGTVGQIPMYRLVRGRWYVGRGRNGNVGRWNGQHFLVVGAKFDYYDVKQEPYFAAASGCFQPFREIDEGRMVQPFGRVGWDAHYGLRMKFGPGEAPQGDG